MATDEPQRAAHDAGWCTKATCAYDHPPGEISATWLRCDHGHDYLYWSHMSVRGCHACALTAERDALAAEVASIRAPAERVSLSLRSKREVVMGNIVATLLVVDEEPMRDLQRALAAPPSTHVARVQQLAEFQRGVVDAIQPQRREDPAATLGRDVTDPATVVAVLDGLRARVQQAMRVLDELSVEYNRDEQCNYTIVNMLIEAGEIVLDGKQSFEDYWQHWVVPKLEAREAPRRDRTSPRGRRAMDEARVQRMERALTEIADMKLPALAHQGINCIHGPTPKKCVRCRIDAALGRRS